MKRSEGLGTEPIDKLLAQQAIPAGIGILILSIYGIVDTIFVGRWIGTMAIGAITVVVPISFLLASIGMAIGVGGASIISRALGAGDVKRASQAFGNQVILTLIFSSLFLVLGLIFMEPILEIFGGKGEILPLAKQYFLIVLLGTPFLSVAMMSNNVIRALGAPKYAMVVMIVPAVANLILDPIFIAWFEWGIQGAAWATTLAYIFSAIYAVLFFRKEHEIKLTSSDYVPNLEITKEIFSIGGVTLARQGSVSLMSIVLNNGLFAYGGELGIATFGIIRNLSMFANFPVLGVTQGFLPIAGYNYGSKHYIRVKETIKKAILYGTGLASIIFLVIMMTAYSIPRIFTEDVALVEASGPAIQLVFLATPLLTIQLIGSAYYQAIGRALPALFLSLLKQGIFLIPLILLLPLSFGMWGIWMAFPIADMLTAIVNYIFLKKATKELAIQKVQTEFT
ncbi:MAG: MATE family efflux transporter [Bacteroidia bacterium]|nr:MATE family efflux transporter [Bacteroidia bacterium]